MDNKYFKYVNRINTKDLNFMNYIIDKISNSLKNGRIIEDNICDDFGNSAYFIADGSFGVVYRFKNYAVKVFIDEYNTNRDGYLLEKLSSSKYFPNVYAYSNDFVIMEFIEGKTLESLRADSENYFIHNNVFETDLDSKELLYDMLSQEIMLADLHGDNIIITKDFKLKLIDVGLYWEYSNCSNDKIEYNNKVKSLTFEINYLNEIIADFFNNIKVPY